MCCHPPHTTHDPCLAQENEEQEERRKAEIESEKSNNTEDWRATGLGDPEKVPHPAATNQPFPCFVLSGCHTFRAPPQPSPHKERHLSSLERLLVIRCR